MNFSYDIHGLVSVNSCESKLIPSYFSADSIKSSNLTINRMGKNSGLIRQGSRKIGSGLFCLKEEKLILSDARIFGLTASWSLKDLWGSSTQLTFNRMYPLLSKTLLRVPISTVFPISPYVQHILHLKLLLKKYTFLVGGCFQMPENSSGVVVSSMGEMGKTTTILEATKTKDCVFFGDDMVIINRDGTIYSYPKEIRIRKSVGPFCRETFLPPTSMFVSSKIAKKTNVSVMCLLERGAQDEIKFVTPEEAANKLLVIVRKLLPYYLERTILAYSYMDDSVNLYDLMNEEREIIDSFLKKANCCCILRSNKASNYLKLVLKVAGKYAK